MKENTNITNSSVSFLQSGAWEELQRRLGRKTIRCQTPGLSGFGILVNARFGNHYAYFPHGPSGVWSAENINEFVEKTREAAGDAKPFFFARGTVCQG